MAGRRRRGPPRDPRAGLYWQGFTVEERRALERAGFSLGGKAVDPTGGPALDDEMAVLRILIRRALGTAEPDGPETTPDGPAATGSEEMATIVRLMAQLARLVAVRGRAGGTEAVVAAALMRGGQAVLDEGRERAKGEGCERVVDAGGGRGLDEARGRGLGEGHDGAREETCGRVLEEECEPVAGERQGQELAWEGEG